MGKRTGRCVVLAVMLMAVCLLSSCGVKAKTEKEVIADLQASRWFISENLEIKSYEITKRQTDIENKKDLIYVMVRAENADVVCDLSYTMTYVLYNDGWVLETVYRDYEGVWTFGGLTTEHIEADILEVDGFYHQWNLTITTCETVEETEIFDGEQYGKRLRVYVAAEQDALCSEAEYTIEYLITDDGWKLRELLFERMEYWPTYGPKADVAENIVKTLKTDDHIVKVSYDSHKYKETDNSMLRSQTATVYYTAQKKWSYCTETYLIEIPYTFSLESGELTWICNTNAIKSKLYNVDFKIQGTRWTCNYNTNGDWGDALSGYAMVDLKIGNITKTEDPEKYMVQVQCDASSGEYSYYCKTDSEGRARLIYSRPGQYLLSVSGQPEGDVFWAGTFYFDDSATRDYDRGVFWKYNSYNNFTNGAELKQMS